MFASRKGFLPASSSCSQSRETHDDGHGVVKRIGLVALDGRAACSAFSSSNLALFAVGHQHPGLVAKVSLDPAGHLIRGDHSLPTVDYFCQEQRCP